MIGFHKFKNILRSVRDMVFGKPRPKLEPLKQWKLSIIDGVAPELVEIGENFISAPGSVILTHDASTLTHSGQYRLEPTKIGDNVFIGYNAIILAGVSIGDNVIVGAGAVVTKDVPSNSVCAGNPAKVITSTQAYIEKCKERDVLFSVPDSFLEKHGTLEPYTSDEINEFRTHLLAEYVKRNNDSKST